VIKLLKSKWLIVISALFSFLSFSSSLFAQYFFDIEPCNLCIAQRYIHVLIFVVSTLLIFPKEKKWLKQTLLILFLISSLVAFYHFAIQKGVLQDYCSLGPSVKTKEAFKALLKKPISCSKISWTFLGFSVAFWNGLSSLIISALFFKKIKK
jgi:disulfide bond formation protein DsbB